MSGFFITATGTEIGKTYVTAGLIRALRARGYQPKALKPVLSGYEDPAGSDPALLLEALGEEVTPQTIAQISPWRFIAPLSPDMAAAREGRAIDMSDLLSFCRKAKGDPLLIEGVGGVLVPLDTRHTVRDWIAELGLPAIVVTGSYLGTLSHTLTALEALAARNIAIACLVLNQSEGGVDLKDSAATLARFAPSVPMVTLPRFAKASQFTPLLDALRLAGTQGHV